MKIYKTMKNAQLPTCFISLRVIICLGAVVEGDSDGVSAVNNLQWTGKV